MTDWVRHAIWWQVYPLSFTGAERTALPEGAEPVPRLRQVEAWLPHLVQLGCNGLTLGPVFAAQTHGYDTVDHVPVDPRLGTEADLQRLLDACSAAGVRVVLDGVFDHVGRGHPGSANCSWRGPTRPPRAGSTCNTTRRPPSGRHPAGEPDQRPTAPPAGPGRAADRPRGADRLLRRRVGDAGWAADGARAAVADLYRTLIGLRRRHPWLVDAQLAEPDVLRNEVLAVRLTGGDQQLALVLNLGDAPAEVVLPLRRGHGRTARLLVVGSPVG